MDNLHDVQMDIIRSLTFAPGMRFSDLNTKSLPSDQFSYHIRTLSKLGYIEKSKEGTYSLTAKGKHYSSHMDTNVSRIEKLPKTSVLVIPVRKVDGVVEYLIHNRKKEPYYGYSGFITGKIRFGETVEQAAKRELEEEAGVIGAKFEHHFVIHEMVYNKEGQQLEDKFFNVVSFEEVTGDIISSTEDGDNIWVTEEVFRNMSPLFHNELDMLDWYLSRQSSFLEEKYYIEEY